MSRFDRFLTLYAFDPLGGLNPAKKRAIPILMYHSVSDELETGHPYYWINTSTEVFAEHMSYLYGKGYLAISLQDLIKKNHDGKRVVITFDDGFSSIYSEAFPILKKYGFSATIFLATAYVGGEQFKGRRCLNWEQIRELHAAGISIGSHTHTHPRLSDLPRPAIVQELRVSKTIIEDMLGSAVTEFSYPYRFPEENRAFRELIREELANAGYTRGVTTIIGRYRAADDAMLLKRIPVNSDDDEVFFDAKLRGGYDWFHAPQYVVKRLRSIMG